LYRWTNDALASLRYRTPAAEHAVILPWHIFVPWCVAAFPFIAAHWAPIHWVAVVAAPTKAVVIAIVVPRHVVAVETPAVITVVAPRHVAPTIVAITVVIAPRHIAPAAITVTVVPRHVVAIEAPAIVTVAVIIPWHVVVIPESTSLACGKESCRQCGDSQ